MFGNNQLVGNSQLDDVCRILSSVLSALKSVSRSCPGEDFICLVENCVNSPFPCPRMSVSEISSEIILIWLLLN